MKSWRQEEHPAIGNKHNCHITRLFLEQLRAVKHCLSAVKRVWSFTDGVLATLKVNDDDGNEFFASFATRR